LTNTPKIWACNIIGDVRLQGSRISYDIDPSINTPKNKLEAVNHYRAWQALNLNEVPVKLFFNVSDFSEKRKNLKDVSMITDGLAIVSERFADLLKDFNLGATQLFEIPLFEFDQETQRSGKYFLLNVAETKPCFLPEQTTHVKAGAGTGLGFWRLRGFPEVSVLPSAAEGADMWADPTLRQVIFMSDRMVKAIKAAKISPVPLKLCNVILPN